jgi:hypothetical protein
VQPIVGQADDAWFKCNIFFRERNVHDFSKTVLFTAADGRAVFREEKIPLAGGTPQMMVSAVFSSGGYQLRHSPVGFRSPFHCSPIPQWVFILGGEMEIGLQDGSTRIF